MQDHHDLHVWRRAHEHAVEIHRTIRTIRGSDHASLRAQTKRAAESIVFNIIEGCHARTNRDFARFLDISIKSSGELEGQLELARDYDCLQPTTWAPLREDTIEIRKMLCGLRRRVLEADAEGDKEERSPPNTRKARNSKLELDTDDLGPLNPRDDS